MCYQICDLGQFRLLKKQIIRQKTKIKRRRSLGETQRDKEMCKVNILINMLNIEELSILCQQNVTKINSNNSMSEMQGQNRSKNAPYVSRGTEEQDVILSKGNFIYMLTLL